MRAKKHKKSKARGRSRGFRGLSGSPAEHEERGRSALNWATGHLREARSAKRCAVRVMHATEALDSAAAYREEMRWTPRANDAIATAASIRKQAIELINNCIVR